MFQHQGALLLDQEVSEAALPQGREENEAYCSQDQEVCEVHRHQMLVQVASAALQRLSWQVRWMRLRQSSLPSQQQSSLQGQTLQ